MDDPEALIQFCRALASPTRVQLLRLLGRQALCVRALARKLDLTPGAISQHLQVLRQAELVVAEKRGYFLHYRLNPTAWSRWRPLLAELLAGSPPPHQPLKLEEEILCAAGKVVQKSVRIRRS